MFKLKCKSIPWWMWWWCSRRVVEGLDWLLTYILVVWGSKLILLNVVTLLVDTVGDTDADDDWDDGVGDALWSSELLALLTLALDAVVVLLFGWYMRDILFFILNLF